MGRPVARRPGEPAILRGVPVTFTLEQARATLDGLREILAGFLDRRADLAELRADLDAGVTSPLGGLAELKALEAAVYADLEHIAARGVEVKGFAPLLLDFPGERAGVEVRWCWLEAEPDIEWYHRADCGFPGRRQIAE